MASLRSITVVLITSFTLLAGCSTVPRAFTPQDPIAAKEFSHQVFHEVLGTHVEQGLVDYPAIDTDHRFERYIQQLDRIDPSSFPTRQDRLAFWINAYNAFVLQSVVDRYPIRGRAKEYPPDSLRQIHGAFDKRTFRAAGRTVTLDAIEKTMLPEFKDPRAYFAVSAAAVGSGRLRSETYRGADLETQLAAAKAEFLTTQEHVQLDRVQNELAISAIIGWHEQEFVAAFGGSDPKFDARSPIERAVIALLSPHLYPSERQFLERNEFRVRYKEYDWRLNDLGKR